MLTWTSPPMYKPDRPAVLPIRQGVSPSCVAVPAGPWPTLLDFLVHRLPKVSREDWVQRMARGDVVCERGVAVTPERPFEHSLRLFYYLHKDIALKNIRRFRR